MWDRTYILQHYIMIYYCYFLILFPNSEHYNLEHDSSFPNDLPFPRLLPHFIERQTLTPIGATSKILLSSHHFIHQQSRGPPQSLSAPCRIASSYSVRPWRQSTIWLQPKSDLYFHFSLSKHSQNSWCSISGLRSPLSSPIKTLLAQNSSSMKPVLMAPIN